MTTTASSLERQTNPANGEAPAQGEPAVALSAGEEALASLKSRPNCEDAILCRTRSGRFIHASFAGSSVTHCGVWLRAAASYFAVPAYRVQAANLCENCFGSRDPSEGASGPPSGASPDRPPQADATPNQEVTMSNTATEAPAVEDVTGQAPEDTAKEMVSLEKTLLTEAKKLGAKEQERKAAYTRVGAKVDKKAVTLVYVNFATKKGIRLEFPKDGGYEVVRVTNEGDVASALDRIKSDLEARKAASA